MQTTTFLPTAAQVMENRRHLHTHPDLRFNERETDSRAAQSVVNGDLP